MDDDDLLDAWGAPPPAPAPISSWDMLEQAAILEIDGPDLDQFSAWRCQARPEQIPPSDSPSWLYWLVLAGRGFGKTWMGSRWLAEIAQSERGDYGIIAPTLTDARVLCVEGPSGLLVALGGENSPTIASYNRSDYIVTLSNGSRIKLGSADAPQRIRGWNFRGVWADEVGAWRDRVVWDEGIKFATRIGSPKILLTTTPKRGNTILLDLIKKFERAGGSRSSGGLAGNLHLTTGRTSDNAANLSEEWLVEMTDSYAGTTLGAQELDGVMLLDVEGALVSETVINFTRVSDPTTIDLDCVVVAVDPSVTNTEESDECGIVVMGVGPAPEGWSPPVGVPGILHDTPHLYILADYSARMSPEAWARRALDAADEWEADEIVAEVNQGGDMVSTLLGLVADGEGRELPPINSVRAAVGKIARAEPVGGYWQQGRVHVLGSMPLLEEQWSTWVPGRPSPDRLDATVWGAVALVPTLGAKAGTRVRLLAG